MASGSGQKFTIGVDVGGTNIRSGLVGARGRVYHRDKRSTPRGGDAQEIIAAILASIGAMLSKPKVTRRRVSGIGVAAPGPLNTKTGVIINPPNLPSWRDLPLKRILEKELRMPVEIDNDANAAAVGEHWIGAGKGADSMIMMTLGTGVGGGLIIGGKLWHGASDVAGEIGHTTINPEGMRCACGNKGCLEVYVSATGIAERMRSVLDRGGSSLVVEMLNGNRSKLTSELIYEAAEEGDLLSRLTLEDTGVLLGIGVANLINIFNPELVVVGGGVTRAGKLIFDPMKAEANKRSFQTAANAVKIVPGELGDDAGIIGAARIVMMRKRRS